MGRINDSVAVACYNIPRPILLVSETIVTSVCFNDTAGNSIQAKQGERKAKRANRSVIRRFYRADARDQTAPARRSRPAKRPGCAATRTTSAKPAMAATREPFCTFDFDTL